MNVILHRHGNRRLTPWRLADDIHWYTPGLVFGPCPSPSAPPSSASSSSPSPSRRFASSQEMSRKECDRAQVLLPSAFPKLWGRASPRVLSADGAVMFGHSTKFPLRYVDKRGSVPKEGEILAEEDVENTMEGFHGLFVDSGIGAQAWDLRIRGEVVAEAIAGLRWGTACLRDRGW